MGSTASPEHMVLAVQFLELAWSTEVLSTFPRLLKYLLNCATTRRQALKTGPN